MTRTRRVAIATCAELPQLDEDGPPLRVALARLDVEAVPAVWDDPSVDWAAFDLVVVRSTWDYAPRREAFLSWAASVAAVTRLHNPLSVMRWNTDKQYLAELRGAGLPVVPTIYLKPGMPIAWDFGGEIVVKPAVSAGAKDTRRYEPSERDAAVAHVAALLASDRVVMVQPYQIAIDTAAETAVIFIDGEVSHAIRKAPILVGGASAPSGLYAIEGISPRRASPAELGLAHEAMARVPQAGALLFGRVDMVPGLGGEPQVLELEVTEPSLFLAHAPGAAPRLARAIATRLGR